MKCAAAVGDLKLLVVSAGLELPKVQEWIPTEAKRLVSSSHMGAQSVSCNNSSDHNSVTLCFSAWDGSFFCSCNEERGMMQQCRAGKACREWKLRF